MLWETVAFASLCGALIGLVLSVFFLLFSGTRGYAALAFAGCLSALCLFMPGFLLSREIRMTALRQMGVRTKPLIAAIEKYEKTKGHAPQELADLVPEFLSAVPKTGIGAYPNYDYTRLKDDSDAWELSVGCSVGLMNWDEFFYRPSKKYEKRYGGWIEPAGDWAYFHE